MSLETEKAYDYCQKVTRRHAKSFYFAAKFLPKKKQKPIYALYALCRHVDDEVDKAEITGAEKIIEAVERWKVQLDRVYLGAENQNHKPEKKASFSANESSKLVFVAWQDLLKKYKIPQNLPLELMEGVLMDTHIHRYETFEELYLYCYRVASTVGLMSSEIFGYENEKTLEYAEALGVAMQLTNILRDVKEDAAMNRIYLPQKDLRKFNVAEEQIFRNEPDENFVELIKFQIARARSFYQKAEKGIPLLEKNTRFTVLLALRLYEKILDEIEKQNYDVFLKRAYTGFGQKVFSIPGVWANSRRL